MKPSKKSQSNIKKFYLLAYNSVEALGWSLILFTLLTYFTNKESKESLFQQCKWLVIIFPNSAVLEIFHAAFGLVPSSPIFTATQVYSRLLIVCGVILPTLAAKESIGLGLTLFAWSFAEIIRYSFYTLSLLNAVPHFLVWLRYTMFFVMYPLGLCGELLVLNAAQQEFGKTGKWSFNLPNCLNFTFSYQYFLKVHMFLFIGVCIMLYKHMIVQRKKVLGAAALQKKHD